MSWSRIESLTSKSQRVLVVLPTYNERDNLKAIVERILEALPSARLWIVDDNSPDGTGALADEIAATHERVEAFHRPSKMGLGTAYAESFERAKRQGYDYVIEMDADFSHDPALLPELLAQAQQADLVLGSRYVPGGATPDWTTWRRLISRIGNLVARFVLGLPIHDATTGYRVFTRRALETLHLEGMTLKGYGFQIETVYQCHRAGLRIYEHPIVFIDRRQGHSKMSRAIVLEALIYVFRRRLSEAVATHRPQHQFGSKQADIEGAPPLIIQGVEPTAAGSHERSENPMHGAHEG
jgi:dolichol-phosphate mannosyltransferase